MTSPSSSEQTASVTADNLSSCPGRQGVDFSVREGQRYSLPRAQILSGSAPRTCLQLAPAETRFLLLALAALKMTTVDARLFPIDRGGYSFACGRANINNHQQASSRRFVPRASCVLGWRTPRIMPS